MNRFLNAAKKQVSRHGETATFVSITEGAYNPETLSSSNTETSYSVKVFKNHIKTSQYNYPNLIGKEVIEFYLANADLVFIPNVKDKIVYNTITYTVESIHVQVALGATVMYFVVAVRN